MKTKASAIYTIDITFSDHVGTPLYRPVDMLRGLGFDVELREDPARGGNYLHAKLRGSGKYINFDNSEVLHAFLQGIIWAKELNNA